MPECGIKTLINQRKKKQIQSAFRACILTYSLSYTCHVYQWTKTCFELCLFYFFFLLVAVSATTLKRHFRTFTSHQMRFLDFFMFLLLFFFLSLLTFSCFNNICCYCIIMKWTPIIWSGTHLQIYRNPCILSKLSLCFFLYILNWLHVWCKCAFVCYDNYIINW